MGHINSTLRSRSRRLITPRLDRVFDPAIARLLRCKAMRLIGRHGFVSADHYDLQQELTMHLIQARRCYDRSRSTSSTFDEHVLSNKVTDLVRYAIAGRRDQRRTRQFPPDLDLPHGRELSPDRATLVLDVRQAVARLPVDLRSIARLLMQCGEAEAARRAGCSRQHVRSVRHQLARTLWSLNPAVRGRTAKRLCA